RRSSGYQDEISNRNQTSKIHMENGLVKQRNVFAGTVAMRSDPCGVVDSSFSRLGYRALRVGISYESVLWLQSTAIAWSGRGRSNLSGRVGRRGRRRGV